MLKDKIPPQFLRRSLDDLGCGDGKVTMMLRDLFQASKIRAFDVNPSLVKRARKKGLEAQVINLDESIPGGELAVIWGVLHHLKNREACIKRITDSYSMAFIREPIKNKVIKGLEMGQPLQKEEIEGILQKYMPSAASFYFGHCIFIFYDGNRKKG